MYVNDILKTKGSDVATLPGSASLAEAAALLKDRGIGALVVSSDARSPEGILSERDIVRAMAEHGSEVINITARAVMSSPVKTCQSTDAVTKVMAEMSASRIRHLPVVEAGQLVGIISIGDVVKNRLDELQSETEALQDYIAGRA